MYKRQLKGTENAEKTAAAAAAVIENLEKAKAGLEQYQQRLEELEKELQKATSDAEKARIQAEITAVSAEISKLQGRISMLQTAIKEKGIDKLETAYQAKSQMTFQQFCQQVLGQSAATAKQMNDLWLVYASGKVEYDKDSPTGAETPDQGGALSGELLHNDPEDSSCLLYTSRCV